MTDLASNIGKTWKRKKGNNYITLIDIVTCEEVKVKIYNQYTAGTARERIISIQDFLDQI